MSRPKTLDHLRSSKKPFTVKIPLILDPKIGDVFDAVSAERDDAYEQRRSFEFLGNPVPPELVRRIEDIEARYLTAEQDLAENTETFVFRGVGRTKFEDLKAQHPPTEKQRARNTELGASAPEYNNDSFPAALLAASCISHEAGEDEWKAMLGDAERWNSAEEALLFSAAMAANNDARVGAAGKGFAATRS